MAPQDQFEALFQIVKEIKEDTRETRHVCLKTNEEVAKHGERITRLETKGEAVDSFMADAKEEQRIELRRNRIITGAISLVGGVGIWVAAKLGYIPEP